MKVGGLALLLIAAGLAGQADPLRPSARPSGPDEMMALASEGIFVTRYPDHPITTTLKDVAEILSDA